MQTALDLLIVRDAPGIRLAGYPIGPVPDWPGTRLAGYLIGRIPDWPGTRLAGYLIGWVPDWPVPEIISMKLSKLIDSRTKINNHTVLTQRDYILLATQKNQLQ
jgi:hypothetical protein